MKFLMNFTTSDDDIRRYSSARDLREYYQRYGLSGLEVMPLSYQDGDIWRQPGQCPIIEPDMVTGVHACCITDWMGLDRTYLLEHYRKDLDYAQAMGAEYVVFHVSQASDEELYTWQIRHTDEEVIDASCALINELLKGRAYSFWFLMENQWWPGLTYLSPDCTRRLLDGIDYKKKGLILDTGHFMHTDLELVTQEEALFSLNAMLDDHRELIPCIKGVHIHQSLTGSYVKNWLKEGNILPEDPEERFCKVYEHIFAIDRHEPFTACGVENLIKRIDPLYVTFEYITRGREEHASYLETGLSACSSLVSHF